MRVHPSLHRDKCMPLATLKRCLGLSTILLILSNLALSSPVDAATFRVASGDITALIAAIHNANQVAEEDHTIHLEAGNYQLHEVNNTINGPNGLPSITSHLTLIGKGAEVTTIRRAPTSPDFRFLHVDRSGNLTLSRLTLTGGSLGESSPLGGAIRNAGALQLSESNIYRNTALYGGGIGNTGRLSLQRSTVHENTATLDGGGLFNEAGDLEAVQSIIQHNTARDGGGIGSISGQVILHRSTVQHNQAVQGGGLVGSQTTYLELRHCRVQLNMATTQGGGILNAAALALHSSVLQDNRAETNGGGLANTAEAVTTIHSSRFSHNWAPNGGGLFNRGMAFSSNSVFQNNTADSNGGGINNHQGTLELYTCDLIANTADSGGGLHSNGGRAILSECVVQENHATAGGGISGTDVAKLEIYRSNIQKNMATTDGGGLLNRATLLVRQSTLQDNISSTNGGGAVNHLGGSFTLLNSTVSGNDSVQGGGLYNDAGTLAITQSTVTNNQARHGGGLTTRQGQVDLSRSIVAGNTSETLVDADCATLDQQLRSLGYNLVGLDTGCPHQALTDQTIAPAEVFLRVLDPLQLNHGPTTTHALKPASPALDRGGPLCPPAFTDQRGMSRPQGKACDIGAFEVGPAAAIIPPALLRLTALTSDLNGDLLVADTLLSGIVHIHRESGHYRLLSGPAVGNGFQLSPNIGGIAVESTRALVATDRDHAAIIRIHPVTGARTVISNGIRGLGPPLEHPTALAREADNNLLVIDTNTIVRVHPETGDRHLVSGCPSPDRETCLDDLVGQGRQFGRLQGLAVNASGQIIVVDRQHQALLQVDPITGDRSPLSDSETGVGPALDTPEALAFEASGTIAVTGFRSIIRVHPETGDRTVISDSTQGAGIPLHTPLAIASLSASTLIVAEQNRLVQIDSETGNRILLTSDQLRGDGPPIPRRTLTLDSTGALVVAGTAAGRHAIISVQPDTGQRAAISDTTVGRGHSLVGPTSIAAEPSGTLVLIDINRRESGTVVRVDHTTGNRTVISGCTRGTSQSCQGEIIGEGPSFRFPQSIAVESNGHLLVGDRDRAAILRIHPTTGNRAIVSDEFTGNGPNLQAPRAIAIAPDHQLLVVDSISSPVPNVTAPDVILQIDLNTGHRTLVSGINRGTGYLSTFDFIDTIALDPDGAIIVASSQFQIIFRVHPLNGNRTVLSSPSVGRGPIFFPGSIVVDADRSLLVLDTQFGAVLRTSPGSGNRMLLSR